MSHAADIPSRLFHQSLTFGREGSEAPYTTTLRLSPEGRVQGYGHANETFWRLHEGCLEFLSAGGAVTTRFDDIIDDRPARLALRGYARTSGATPVHHILSGHGWAPIITALRHQLYSGTDPYGAAQSKYIDTGYPHTSLRRVPDMVEAVLHLAAPRFWLEIGSMLGGSAILTADAITRLGMATGLVAVDPFCGDVNMWAWEHGHLAADKWRFLRLEDGQPTIYRRFIANVAAAGHRDLILPIATTGIVGIRLLERLIREARIAAPPEVIYLDSAHEAEETFLELKSAWRLLPEGGVLWGDDWDWQAVHDDVLRFAATVECNQTTITRLRERLPDATIESGVLLYRGQWLLAK